MSLRKSLLLLLSGAGLYSVANYSAQVATFREKKKIFDGKTCRVIAHRGFSGRYPENTMLAFEKAAELPIDAIELDVHSTRDGKIVVIHDSTLDRTTNKNGRVFDYSWDSLKKVDAGFLFDPAGKNEFPFRGKGVTVPLLEDVLKAFPHMKFIIEIKQTLPAVEEVIYRLIRKYRMEENVIVASEHSEPLQRFRNLALHVATSFSKEEAAEFHRLYRLRLSNFYRCRGDVIAIPEMYKNQKLVTKGFVEAARRKGLALQIWTVNEPQDMERLLDWGVDGIISDFPDVLSQVMAGREKKTAENVG
jgi:glycerophosphoryl diester phosphodiesterase